MADIRNRKPASSDKAPADVKQKGEGMVLALAIIKDTNELADSNARKGESLKKRLGDLCKLSKDMHVTFTATLEDERKAINQRSKDANYTDIKKYFRDGGLAGSKDSYAYSMLSVWQGLSASIQLGYKPDLKAGWSEIVSEGRTFKSKAVDEAKRKQAELAGKKESNAERVAREAKEQADAVKAASNAVMGKIAKKEGEGDNAEFKLTEQGRRVLPDVVAQMCALATVEELDAIVKRLNEMREAKVKAVAEAKAAIDKAQKDQAKVGNPGRAEEPALEHAGAQQGEPRKPRMSLSSKKK